LDFPDFDADTAEVVGRAEAAGIVRIITIGTDEASSDRALALCDRFPQVYAAVGWHPCHIETAPSDLRPWLRRVAVHPKVVAIGETGLDFKHQPEGGSSDGLRFRETQREIFKQHLEVAAELGMNCIVHQRDAFDEVLDVMRRFDGKVRGVFHCFVNSPVEMKRVIDAGSLVSFTGIVTFKNATEVRATMAATPLDRFLLETDSPYLAPVPFRGKRCEPAFVTEIASVIGSVKGCTSGELSRVTCRTAHEFFPKLGKAPSAA
jgi:TatD DNase family protein